MSYVQFALAPIATLVAGLSFAIFFFRIGKVGPKISNLAFVIWAAGSGVAMWYGSLAFKEQLANAMLFSDFTSLIRNTPYSTLVYGSVQQTAAAALIGIYEITMVAGFVILVNIRSHSHLRSQQQQYLKESENAISGSPQIGVSTVVPASRNDDDDEFDFQTMRQKGDNNRAGTLHYSSAGYELQENSVAHDAQASSNTLSKEELTIMELFLFGRVSKITPRVDLSKPEGYFFEGAPISNMDTSRLRQILDSLTRKKLLNLEFSDKILSCKSCGSPNIQLRNMCPSCKSMRLSKHNVLEHFACGLVDKQENFQNSNGDLVCPKCHTKLQLIGSDYRNLSQMYICQECNSRNKDLLQMMKCAGCGTELEIGEENEQYLYAYTLNEVAAQKLGDQIKPLGACIAHFRSLGYTVVSPAFVIGKSGTQHIFDALVLGGVQGLETNRRLGGAPYKLANDSSSNMVLEIIISSNQVNLEQITRAYGKMCDVDCESLIFAIPGASDNARSYASGFNIRLVEGKTIEQALERLNILPAVGSSRGTN